MAIEMLEEALADLLATKAQYGGEEIHTLFNFDLVKMENELKISGCLIKSKIDIQLNQWQSPVVQVASTL